MLKVISKQNLLTTFCKLVTVIATFVAITSAYGCTMWSLEQPKIPKSLIK